MPPPTGIVINAGVTVNAGVTLNGYADSIPAPVASDFTIVTTGDNADYAVGLADHITGSYNSVTIVSVSGDGSAVVSGTEILVSSTAGDAPFGSIHTTTIVYTVTNASGTSNQATITFLDNCCVVATELTSQGAWSTREYTAINLWGANRLDKTSIGRALHRGYHVIAPKVIVPALRKRGTIKAKYFKWSFNNATNMLRGKRFNPLSVVNSAVWITAMTVTGLFASSNQATTSWKSLYKDKK
jgi:hypothetical protein